MESLVLLIGATLAIVIAAVAFLFGRQAATTAPPSNINTSGLEPEIAAEIARLQERERTLSADVARQAGEPCNYYFQSFALRCISSTTRSSSFLW